jgi:myo-inositol 2-dehydrogenase / D-chiro-inositol 1-dehydrogenase
MSGDVRVGLIGAGRIARVHAEAYRQVAGGRLAAVADTDASRREKFADEFGLKPYPDYRVLLQDPTVDAVLIAAPNWLHAEMAIAAAAAGKHVFCQKPLALSVPDAEAILHAVKKSGVTLQVGFMLRFTPPMRKVKDLIDSGALGNVIAIRAAIFGWEPSDEWFYIRERGGGVILDTMIHFADLLQWLAGPVSQVYAEGGAFVLPGAKRHESPDNACVSFHHRAGAMSQLYVSWTTGYGDFFYEVYGSKGSVSVNFLERQVTSVYIKGKNEAETQTYPAGWSHLNMLWPLGYAGEAQYFVDQIRGSAHAGNASGEDGREALKVVLAAQESMDTKRIVRLDG